MKTLPHTYSWLEKIGPDSKVDDPADKDSEKNRTTESSPQPGGYAGQSSPNTAMRDGLRQAFAEYKDEIDKPKKPSLTTEDYSNIQALKKQKLEHGGYILVPTTSYELVRPKTAAIRTFFGKYAPYKETYTTKKDIRNPETGGSIGTLRTRKEKNPNLIKLGLGIFQNKDETRGRVISAETTTGIGVPDGYSVKDKIAELKTSTTAETAIRIRSTIIDPSNNRGKIATIVKRKAKETGESEEVDEGQKAEEGEEKWMPKVDKEYRGGLTTGTLTDVPGLLPNAPGKPRVVATINYGIVRSFQMHGLNPDNTSGYGLSRLQNMQGFAAYRFLQKIREEFPDLLPSDDAALLNLTSMTERANNNLSPVGLRVKPNPQIIRQGTSEWKTAHPGAKERSLEYVRNEALRVTVQLITGKTIPKTDENPEGWWPECKEVIKKHIESTGRTPEARNELNQRIQKQVNGIWGEWDQIKEKYKLTDKDISGYDINFDLIYGTEPLAPKT